MLEPEYSVRQGDYGAVIEGVLRDDRGDPVSIAGADLKIHIGPVGGGPPILVVDAENDQVGDGSDGSRGAWSYTFVAPDEGAGVLDEPGVFVGEIEGTFTGPARTSFPNRGYILIRVTRQVA